VGGREVERDREKGRGEIGTKGEGERGGGRDNEVERTILKKYPTLE
jgi:hypothetical protein